MKHCYKLLGEFWDRLDLPNKIFFMKDNEFINEIDKEYNIFDVNGLRKIYLSDILKIRDKNELTIITNKIIQYKSLLIVVDYFPLDNKVFYSFYYKRLLQIYFYFNSLKQLDNVYLSNNCIQYFKNQSIV